MDIKEAAHIDAAEHSDSVTDDSGATVRRRILVAGLSGTALSLVPFLARRTSASGRNVAATSSSSDTSTAGSSGAAGAVGAATGSTGVGSDVTIGATDASTTDTAAVTTTTAPPRRPTADDIVLLSFAQSMELSIRDLYDVALAQGAFDGPALDAVKAIREAHEAYAQSISGLLGRVAPNTPLGTLSSAMHTDFSGSPKEVVTAARALENTAVATHVDLVGQLVGVDGAALIGSMVVVEARHATVLATVLGLTDIEQQLATDGAALSPSDYTTK